MIWPSKGVLTMLLLALGTLAISGCAEIDPFEVPAEIIRHPLGTESIRIGISKE